MARNSYAWALHVQRGTAAYARLSYNGREGLEWAQMLARDAVDRGLAALLREPHPPPLTPAEIAQTAHVSATTIRARIAQARTEAFGSLTASGIYHRLAAERKRRERGPRYCAAPDCDKPLPPDSTARRRYCPGSRCRVKAHRERLRDEAAQ